MLVVFINISTLLLSLPGLPSAKPLSHRTPSLLPHTPTPTLLLILCFSFIFDFLKLEKLNTDVCFRAENKRTGHLFSAYWPFIGLYIDSHLLQIETSLTKALWVVSDSLFQIIYCLLYSLTILLYTPCWSYKFMYNFTLSWVTILEKIILMRIIVFQNHYLKWSFCVIYLSAQVKNPLQSYKQCPCTGCFDESMAWGEEKSCGSYSIVIKFPTILADLKLTMAAVQGLSFSPSNYT